VNTALSIVFVSAAEPLGGHGVQGIAWGTAIAWVCGCAAALAVLRLQSAPLRLRGRYLFPRRVVLWRVARIAGPNLLENLGHWSGNFISIALIGRLPDTASMAAHTVAVRMEALSFLPGLAMGVAASTLCSQYLGAGQPEMARRAVNWCWLFGVLIMTFMGALFVAVPEFFVRLATNQPELLTSAPVLLFTTGFIQPLFASYLVLSSALRGAGDTRGPMLITYLSTYCVRLPLVYLLGLHLGYGIAGVWVALSTELAVRGLLFIARYKNGRWESIRV
jgi:putative MATE family efflux protein